MERGNISFSFTFLVPTVLRGNPDIGCRNKIGMHSHGGPWERGKMWPRYQLFSPIAPDFDIAIRGSLPHERPGELPDNTDFGNMAVIFFWFPRSSVGTQTLAAETRSVCIPTEDRGNEGMFRYRSIFLLTAFLNFVRFLNFFRF